MASLNVTEEMPVAFHDVIKQLINGTVQPRTVKRNLLVALLLKTMREHGFIPIRTNNEAINGKDFITSIKGDNNDQYEVSYVLTGYNQAAVKLIVNYLNDIALVNAVIKGNFTIYTICIAIDKYIQITQSNMPVELQNINELTTNFEDKIIIPLRSFIISSTKGPDAKLTTLPEVLFHKILSYLPVKDILNVSICCKGTYVSSNKDRLWSILLKRDFPVSIEQQEKLWKDFYIQSYRTEKNNSRLKEQNLDVSNEVGKSYDSRMVVIL